MRQDAHNAAAPAQPPKLLYRITEAMEQLSLSRTMVYRLVKRGDLEQVHIGDASRITAASVHALIERSKRKVA